MPLDDKWEEIAERAIVAAEDVECSVLEFAAGLAVIAATIAERQKWANAELATQERIDASADVLTLIADCVLCGRMFTANPDLVPSIRVSGTRGSICRPCIGKVNRERAARGLQVWPIHPDAYDAGEPER